jgi:hypothetical protein
MPNPNCRDRTLVIRLTRSAFGGADRYAHVEAWHAAEESPRADGSPDYGRLYHHEHKAAEFALSAQCGGSDRHGPGAVLWYAWRIGFRPEMGGSDSAVDAEGAVTALAGCRPIARRIRDELAGLPAPLSSAPAAVIMAAARVLKVRSLTILDVPAGGSARPVRLTIAEHPANALQRAVEALEAFCYPARVAA